MARPAAKELTERELEVMHVFWRLGQATVTETREELALSGTELAVTTVSTLVKILLEKGMLKALSEERPAIYAPARSFEEISGLLLGNLVDRVFGGSRERLLLRLLDQQGLNKRQRKKVERLLEELESEE